MVSEKEVEAAARAIAEAWGETWECCCNERRGLDCDCGDAMTDDRDRYDERLSRDDCRIAARAALSAAARVRAEDNAGEPVGWTCPHDGGWDREMGPIGCLLATHNLDCVCAARFAHPAPQPSGPVEVTSETVHPSHDVRDEDISGISSDPVCQRCRISAYGPDEDRLLKPCPADEHGTNPDDEAVDRFAHPAPQPSGTVEALADALRGVLKAYENTFDWTAELPPETAEAERIANEVLEALTSSKPEQVPSGWKLVPEEPRPEMIGAWWRQKNTGSQEPGKTGEDRSDYAAYRAMLAASPTPPTAGGGDE